MPANKTQATDWHELLLSAARLQSEVQGAVLVGGTAVALLAHHRYSTDADHVVADLTSRYRRVRQHLEQLEGWTTARASKPPVLILGSLDGQAAGVRQLRRMVPLETQVISYAGHPLCVPTYAELMRIKAYLLLARNYSRDYVDFLALSTPLMQDDIKAALAPMDAFYGALAGEVNSGRGLLHDLGRALKKAEPKDSLKGDWSHFDAMDPDRQPWDIARVQREGPSMGDRILTLWTQLDAGRMSADSSHPLKPPSGMF